MNSERKNRGDERRITRQDGNLCVYRRPAEHGFRFSGGEGRIYDSESRCPNHAPHGGGSPRRKVSNTIGRTVCPKGRQQGTCPSGEGCCGEAVIARLTS